MLLKGLKVIEYATYIAAPGAGGLLADWGADVIKIEPPGGDPIRRFFDTIGADIAENPVFDLDNRGKRSIIIDTGGDEGRDLVRRLVADADIFITNVRPGGLTRAGLDYAALSAVNPALIYANVTGYGLEGPDVDRAGFDVAAFWSRSGWARLTAPKGVDPFPIRTGVGDHICSLATVAGILAALHSRSLTGKGQHVDASLLRAGTYTLGSDMSIQMRFGRLASTRPRLEAVNPLANFFQCRDGRWLTLLPRQGTADWPGFCAALGLERLQNDPRFATSKARREHGAELVGLMDAVFASRDFADIAESLDAHDLVWAPVQSPAETVADPQFLAAGGITQIADGAGGFKASPSGPIRFPGLDETTKPAVPAPGQDARAVLADAGFSPEEIEALIGKSVVAERL
ncbi:cinnamoyl-CoA:phenyllactate CoA-transferase [Candidatus Phycosocius bacilliformis]|uniref:Cinnamoyl-CoA:phenyllactate CoA-transferase n=1 Tax=Candidatus Phycosocius bacilliformis TaxID=1445552 RepID=A0A2P2E7N1_9PROT|nr:CaiB/BaiF CoA-transferase family protein [Candidatus Phycosocius bacilliformis]GBF57072.1 cinnamoyl-CoA:phenyllactate CoA-transferase [Candidatus Phycosocius bacilliformis]